MKKILSFAPVLLAAIVLSGCELLQGDPPPSNPTTIVITNVNTNTNTVGQPATVQPGDETSNQPIATVDISQFGEQCPTGTVADWELGDPPHVRQGCSADITCTPKDADNVPVSQAIHGPAPDLFGMTGGPAGTNAVQEANRFNMTVKAGKTPGTATFLCVVKGISSPSWSLAVQ